MTIILFLQYLSVPSLDCGIGQPTVNIVQRVLDSIKVSSSDVVMKRARRGTIAAGYFKLLLRFMFLIIFGMIMRIAFVLKRRFTDNPDTALVPWLSLYYLPVKGIVTIGFISAIGLFPWRQNLQLLRYPLLLY